MLLSLDYLTSLFYCIPKAVLATIIIMAVNPLYDTKIFGTLWYVKSMYMDQATVPTPVTWEAQTGGWLVGEQLGNFSRILC